jgi:uncharacterized protein (DUF488 family)
MNALKRYKIGFFLLMFDSF